MTDPDDSFCDHKWGEVEASRFSGNPHRKCVNCFMINLDLGEDDMIVLCEALGTCEHINVDSVEGYNNFAGNWIQDYDEANRIIDRLREGEIVMVNESDPYYIQRFSTGE